MISSKWAGSEFMIIVFPWLANGNSLGNFLTISQGHFGAAQWIGACCQWDSNRTLSGGKDGS